MEIQVGKFYKTHDGRKVGPIRKWVGENYEWAVDYDNKEPYLEGFNSRDLIEEWRDEPKSPIEEKMILCRRVHYGEYGNLTIYESQGDLRIEFNKSKHTAEELEEAAHILVQVADFLRSEEIK